MNNKICIFIVGDACDAFTTNEVPYLARAFKKVHIFAMNRRNDSAITASYPKNVLVHQVNVMGGRLRIPLYVMKGLLCRCSDLLVGFDSPKRMLTRLYARGRSAVVTKFILKALARHCVEKGSNIKTLTGAVYSYWFTDQAIAAWRVAETLNKKGGSFKAFSRAHGYDLYWERNAAGYLPYQDVSLSHLEGVYPCSEFGAKYLASKYPQLSHKIHVARLGTDDFGVGPVPKSQKVFATCCNFAPLKRMPLFAEAFCRLWKGDRELRWYCIGDGADMSRTKAIVERYGADAGVAFLGNVENKQLMQFYKETPISYFVNVSTTEGVPVSVMEAMSFGIPCIATNVGGSGELVSDVCGMLINANLACETLAAIIKSGTTMDEMSYAKLRIGARKTWKEISSAGNNFDDWCKILKL